jgi:hypothetical protein
VVEEGNFFCHFSKSLEFRSPSSLGTFLACGKRNPSYSGGRVRRGG